MPAKHRHAAADVLVDYHRNALDFARAYRKLGGTFELVTVDGLGHEAHPAFFNGPETVGFMNSLEW